MVTLHPFDEEPKPLDNREQATEVSFRQPPWKPALQPPSGPEVSAAPADPHPEPQIPEPEELCEIIKFSHLKLLNLESFVQQQ